MIIQSQFNWNFILQQMNLFNHIISDIDLLYTPSALSKMISKVFNNLNANSLQFTLL